MNNSNKTGLPVGPISLVVFDMDGVIADTGDRHHAAWTSYMKGMGKSFTDENFRAIFGVGAKDFCPMLFPELSLTEQDIRRITDEKESIFRESARGVLKTYSGFYDFLDLCDQRKIPMAVGSSACRANVDFILGELGISSRFAATVSSDDVDHAKPAPDIFLKAASDVGIEPARALVIEDSLMGIAAAAAAGMRVAGLATTHMAEELTAADYVVGDFLELMDLISGSLIPDKGIKSGAA